MTHEQQHAFDHPLIGRDEDGDPKALTTWRQPPWTLALSFNR